MTVGEAYSLGTNKGKVIKHTDGLFFLMEDELGAFMIRGRAVRLCVVTGAFISNEMMYVDKNSAGWEFF